MSKYLTEREVASMLAVAPATLRGWRVKGNGPSFVKIGRAVRYPEAALNDYLRQNARLSTTDAGGRE